jgi:hypothetical protein
MYCPQRIPNIVDGPFLDAFTDKRERTYPCVLIIEAWIYIHKDAVKDGSHVDWESCSRDYSNRTNIHALYIPVNINK